MPSLLLCEMMSCISHGVLELTKLSEKQVKSIWISHNHTDTFDLDKQIHPIWRQI